jgi:hypothetical protein
MKYKVTVESSERFYETQIPVGPASEIVEFLGRVSKGGARSVMHTLENGVSLSPVKFEMAYEQDSPSEPGRFRFHVSESMFEVACGMIKLEVDGMTKRAS